MATVRIEIYDQAKGTTIIEIDRATRVAAVCEAVALAIATCGSEVSDALAQLRRSWPALRTVLAAKQQGRSKR